MLFGGPTPESEARDIVPHARDHGVNFIDTADVYEKGASERITGAAVASSRDHWVAATKVGKLKAHAQAPGCTDPRYPFFGRRREGNS